MQTLGKRGFCALPCNFDESIVVVIPAGDFDNDTPLTRYAPMSILQASCHSEFEDFDESFMTTGGMPCKDNKDDLERDLKRCERLQSIGVVTLDLKERKFDEFGCLPHNASLGEAKDQWMENCVKNIAMCGKIPIVLGGDQNVTVPVFNGLNRVFGKLIILHFDSYLDARKAVSRSAGYNPGYNSRTVMRHLFSSAERIISVGGRGFNKEEMKFVRQNSDKIDMLRMEDQLRPLWHLNTAINRITHCIGKHKVYVSFDISFLDPSTIGAFATVPEPGGMTYGEILYMWKEILSKINIVGADFVGFCPTRKPISIVNPEEFDSRFKEELFPPSYALAKLIARFISRLNI
ncbi:MAG: arginase family protein [Patescibacteria group bacterium]|nr:arginase family protein [Patescibacteria group bacterium]